MAHEHNHSHHKDHGAALSFEEKLITILNHWIKHNEDHIKVYKEWSTKAKDKGLEKICPFMADAVEMTEGINLKFKEALKEAIDASKQT